MLCTSLFHEEQRGLIKGHLGPSEALLRVASSLAGSGIGVWADMDQLVAEEPSLAALRVDCA